MPTKEQFFNEAIRRFCSSLDITIALRRLFDYICTVMPLRLITIGVLDLELKRFRLIAKATADDSVSGNVHYFIHDKTIEVMKSRSVNKPVLHGDLAASNNYRQTFEGAEPSIRDLFKDNKVSNLSLPLLIDGELVGAFMMFASGINQYSQKHADLLEPLQEPFALVMSNCLQYQEIMRLKEILAEDNRHLHQELLTASNEVIGKDHDIANGNGRQQGLQYGASLQRTDHIMFISEALEQDMDVIGLFMTE